ncbi:MAG: hypothetical protein OHK0040_11630 [bacterium]
MKRTLLFLIILFLFNGCIEHPEISIKDIRLDGIVQGDIKLKIMVDIYNPNNFSVTLNYVEYKLYNEDLPAGNGVWEGEELLEANSTKTLPFLVSIDKDMLMKVFAAFLKGKSSDMQSKMRVEIKAVLKKFGKNFNYNYTWHFKDKNKDKKGDSKNSLNDKRDAVKDFDTVFETNNHQVK